MITASLTCAGCGNVNPADTTRCLACGQALQGNTTVSRSLTGLLTADHLLKQRYRIIAQIGKGGFAAVYQAADSAFGDRLVAIKEMSQNCLTPQGMAEATQAFKREALLLAKLRHPNLPRIYDYFSDAGRWYLVMDFIEGQTLEERLHSLPGRGLAGEEVLGIGIQLCSVLEYLHTHQPPIIFRDLKPANVMRTPAGHLYLIDFGIARHFKPGQSKDTMPLGSSGYAAPEQYGKGQTTPRSDIYSLGVTLHQLLTGCDPAQTPFRLAPLQLYGHPILSQLETLIKHMSELGEATRPQSIAVVKQALQRIAKQQVSEPQRGVPSQAPSTPQTASPTGTPMADAQDREQQPIMSDPRQHDPLPRRGLSRRSVLIGAGAGLLALADGGITWRWLARPQPTAIPARRPIPTSLSIPAPNIVSSGVGIIHLYASFSFDLGKEVSSGADVLWTDAPGRYTVWQVDETKLANLGVVDFDAIDLAALQKLSYSKYRVLDGASGLAEHDVFAVATTRGNRAKVLLVSIGDNLHIRWVTYKNLSGNRRECGRMEESRTEVQRSRGGRRER